MGNRSDRHTFVLRCWPEKNEQGNVITWRFALENVSTRQQRGFADADALLDFLQDCFMDRGSATSHADGRPQ